MPLAWRRLDELFDAVYGRPDAEREAFLQQLQTAEPELAAELRRRLCEGESPPDAQFIDDLHAGFGAAARAAVEIPAGTCLLGRYTVLQRLGGGGMAEIYQVREHKFDRVLALKLLGFGYVGHPEAERRFEAEARLTAKLQHPNIVPVHDVGRLDDRHEGRLFYAMEQVEGATLRALLQDASGEPAQRLAKLLDVFEKVCAAVAFAHARQEPVVHRDLKPDNVMVGRFDDVQVLDWGIAKVLGQHSHGLGSDAPFDPLGFGRETHGSAETTAGRVLGTASYMAPEQARAENDRVGPRTDVFALGALLCEILTGLPPYQEADEEWPGENNPSQPESVRHNADLAARWFQRAQVGDVGPGLKRLQSCGADPDLVRIAAECLAVDRELRPADGGAVASRVAQYKADVRKRAEDERVQREKRAEAERRAEAEKQARDQAEKRAEEQTRRARAERQKRRLTVTFASFVLLTLVGGGAALAFWWQGQVERRLAEEHRSGLIEADLKQAEESLRREDWSLTKQLLERAGGRMDAGARGSLRQRQEALYDQLLFVQELEKLRERGLQFDAEPGFQGPGDQLLAKVGNGGLRDRLTPGLEKTRGKSLENSRERAVQFATGGLRVVPLGPEYAEIFRRRGMRFGEQEATKIAEQIEHSPVRVPIIQALHHWFGNDKANRGHLLAVLNQVDAEDAWRAELRKGIRDGQLESTPVVDVKGMKPHALRCMLFLVQGNPELLMPVRGSDNKSKQVTVKGLRDATFLVQRLQEAYPNDFWFNLFAAGSALMSRPRRLQEGVGYARTAVALRPESPQAHYLVGCMLLEKPDDVEGAIRYFRRALEVDPTHSASHTALGLALERQKDLPGAVEAHQRAIALNPQFAVPYINLASTLRATGNIDGALTAVRKALELDAELARAHNNLGMLLKDKGDREGAVRHLKKAIDCDSDDAVAHFNLGAILREEKNLEGAIAAYRKAVALDPGYARAHNNLGSALNEQGDHAGAVRAYETAIALDSGEALYWSNLGEALRTKRELDAAVRAFKRAIELESKGAVYHNNLGAALQEMGDGKEAIAAFARAVELDPKFVTAHVNHGVALLKRGRKDDAIAALQKAVALDSGSSHAQYNLGSAFLAKSNWDAAIKAFNTSIRLDATFALAYNDLASAFRKKGDLRQAKSAFERATQIDPKFAPAYFNLGDLLLQLNDVEGSIRACRKAVEIDPKSVEAYNNLGAALHTKKDWEGASDAYEAAIRIAPGNTRPYRNLADMFLAKGEEDKAIALWRKVVQIDPKDGFIQVVLAGSLIRTKDYDGAIAVLKLAIQALPGNGDLYHYLAHALIQKSDWEGALGAYRRGVEADPEREALQSGLAMCLQKKGDFSNAITAWRKVVKINPKNGDGWFSLGTCCRMIGSFKEAVQAFEQAENYGSIIPGHKFPTEPLRSVRRLADLDAKLDRVLAGAEKPRDAKETVNLAFLCREYKQRYLAATRFYLDAFKESPELADDLRSHRRFEAACAAALASGRKGKDAGELADDELPRLRALALGWLKAELAYWSKQLASEKAADREQARRTLETWQKAPDLAAVREPSVLAKLPESERAEWGGFWDDVSNLLKSATRKE